MKRLIVAAILFLMLGKPAHAVEVHTVYLPMVKTSPVFVIDCMDSYGRLMECP